MTEFQGSLQLIIKKTNNPFILVYSELLVLLLFFFLFDTHDEWKRLRRRPSTGHFSKLNETL